jgi:hypothetical protein
LPRPSRARNDNVKAFNAFVLIKKENEDCRKSPRRFAPRDGAFIIAFTLAKKEKQVFYLQLYLSASASGKSS